MTQTSESLDLEPRWPILLTILIVFGLSFLPGRVRAFPPWVIFVLTVILLVPMAAIRLSSNKTRWLRIERVVSTFFVLFAAFGMLLDLKDLFVKMVTPPTGITGIQLLNSSISLWGTNVLVFAVAYWRIDRGAALPVRSGHPVRPTGSFLAKKSTTVHRLRGGRLSWTIYSWPSAPRRHSHLPRRCL